MAEYDSEELPYLAFRLGLVIAKEIYEMKDSIHPKLDPDKLLIEFSAGNANLGYHRALRQRLGNKGVDNLANDLMAKVENDDRITGKAILVSRTYVLKKAQNEFLKKK